MIENTIGMNPVEKFEFVYKNLLEGKKIKCITRDLNIYGEKIEYFVQISRNKDFITYAKVPDGPINFDLTIMDIVNHDFELIL
jgi:hypothetical protein